MNRGRELSPATCECNAAINCGRRTFFFHSDGTTLSFPRCLWDGKSPKCVLRSGRDYDDLYVHEHHIDCAPLGSQ